MNELNAISEQRVTEVPSSADPVPNPPGGGRWKWDETNREWISLDPKPESDEQAAE